MAVLRWLNDLLARTGERLRPDYVEDWIEVAFTVGAEDADVVNAAVQVSNKAGNDLSGAVGLLAWLSDTAGAGEASAAPSGGVAIGTDGVILLEHTAGITFHLLTDAAGAADIDVTEAGTATFYLNVLLPDGRIVSSDALSFTA